MQAGNGKCIMCAAHTAHCACVHHAYVHHAHNALIHTASNGFNVIFQSTFSIALLDFQYAKAIISEMNVELFFFNISVKKNDENACMLYDSGILSVMRNERQRLWKGEKINEKARTSEN